MYIYKIEATNHAIIEKIISIHDEMPAAWDPDHQITPEYRLKVLKDIQSTKDHQGFWVLSSTEKQEGISIDGLIWAKILNNHWSNQIVCSVKSFWIKPEIRNNGLSIQLTDPI